ncbi:hypothetical protein HDU83_008537 [Entophlyctis luteolus]|nr:hypothetical protein HDU83_008537 [Entophlyctis luteolus]
MKEQECFNFGVFVSNNFPPSTTSSGGRTDFISDGDICEIADLSSLSLFLRNCLIHWRNCSSIFGIVGKISLSHSRMFKAFKRKQPPVHPPPSGSSSATSPTSSNAPTAAAKQGAPPFFGSKEVAFLFLSETKPPALAMVEFAGSAILIKSVPDFSMPYTCVSHVWGLTREMDLCGRNVKIKSESKRDVLAHLIQTSTKPIWLDLTAMHGYTQTEYMECILNADRIYENAENVITLLSHEELEHVWAAERLLMELLVKSMAVNGASCVEGKLCSHIVTKSSCDDESGACTKMPVASRKSVWGEIPEQRIFCKHCLADRSHKLSVLARLYKIDLGEYSTRIWTLQEHMLARRITFVCEEHVNCAFNIDTQELRETYLKEYKTTGKCPNATSALDVHMRRFLPRTFLESRHGSNWRKHTLSEFVRALDRKRACYNDIDFIYSSARLIDSDFKLRFGESDAELKERFISLCMWERLLPYGTLALPSSDSVPCYRPSNEHSARILVNALRVVPVIEANERVTDKGLVSPYQVLSNVTQFPSSGKPRENLQRILQQSLKNLVNVLLSHQSRIPKLEAMQFSDIIAEAACVALLTGHEGCGPACSCETCRMAWFYFQRISGSGVDSGATLERPSDLGWVIELNTVGFGVFGAVPLEDIPKHPRARDAPFFLAAFSHYYNLATLFPGEPCIFYSIPAFGPETACCVLTCVPLSAGVDGTEDILYLTSPVSARLEGKVGHIVAAHQVLYGVVYNNESAAYYRGGVPFQPAFEDVALFCK